MKGGKMTEIRRKERRKEGEKRGRRERDRKLQNV